MSLEKLIENLKGYSDEDIKKIKEAFYYARDLHKGQYRQSGEEYIIHPLWVAYILSEMHADADTICAGLLHDTLEDTVASKGEIIELFNEDVANLVDGVTKISKLNFSTKEEERMANTRKIIVGITDDVRIIIIKLADRLHNMRTLEFKKVEKQKENALETLEIFVPLAYYIGAYRLKSELEDLSFYYLKKDNYLRIEEKRNAISSEYSDSLLEMSTTISDVLNDNNIPNEIKMATKNLYGIYKKVDGGAKLSDIHDLLSLKVIVDDKKDCYSSLGYIHSKYKPVDNLFKDYICNPKTNMYSSLHTTLFGKRLVQARIRTQEMDKIASYGLATYWDINKDNARENMQSDLREKFQFFESLIQINSIFGDNSEFVRQIKKELFGDNVYVYTSKGLCIQLPKGATPVDFAYKVGVGDIMVYAKVNDDAVSFDYTLKNGDRVDIITDNLSFGDRDDLLKYATSETTRNKILTRKRDKDI